MKKKESGIQQLLGVMAKLRSPEGCPWDREQDHMSLRFHAVEEVY
ncbi:MAG: mazG1, partial [Verrucomicrobiales bacterium]|nr:mazG1 [Verrucomicrobiales bacterium]